MTDRFANLSGQNDAYAVAQVQNISTCTCMPPNGPWAEYEIDPDVTAQAVAGPSHARRGTEGRPSSGGRGGQKEASKPCIQRLHSDAEQAVRQRKATQSSSALKKLVSGMSPKSADSSPVSESQKSARSANSIRLLAHHGRQHSCACFLFCFSFTLL